MRRTRQWIAAGALATVVLTPSAFGQVVVVWDITNPRPPSTFWNNANLAVEGLAPVSTQFIVRAKRWIGPGETYEQNASQSQAVTTGPIDPQWATVLDTPNPTWVVGAYRLYVIQQGQQKATSAFHEAQDPMGPVD